MATGLTTVLQVLEQSGFRRLPMPVVVAGASFDFDAALIGTGVSQDLIVVGGLATDPRRLAQLLSGLNRSLDRLGSRRPVSLVLLGDRPDRALLARFEAAARVMILDTSEPTEAAVEEAVAILLPLRLPSAGEVAIAPLDEVRDRLSSRVTNDHRALIDAASSGPDVVQEVLRKYLAAAFGQTNGNRSS
jgi:hypothetical protein